MKKIIILLTFGLLLINNSYCKNYNTSIDTLQVHVYDNTYNVYDNTIILTTAIAELYSYNDTATLYVNKNKYSVKINAIGEEPEITTIIFEGSLDIFYSEFRRQLYITCYANCWDTDCDKTTVDRVILLIF